MITPRFRRSILALLLATTALFASSCDHEDWDFSFVIIADPHIAGTAEHDTRLLAAVDWINANREQEKVELVLVLGDIGWGTGQIARARQMLDGLDVTYVPIIGDNEMHNWSEQGAVEDWASHYSTLAGQLDNWSMAPWPTWNPEFEQLSYFTNFSFDYKRVHFMGLDWVTRLMDPILGEGADLHDFAGGTWEWFMNDLIDAPVDRLENTVMLSHHPMHQQGLGAFDASEISQVTGATSTRGDQVSMNFAGHYHINLEHTVDEGQYDVVVTDATWDDQNTVRLVKVTDDGTTISYQHQIIQIP